jgi:hypothetical protein
MQRSSNSEVHRQDGAKALEAMQCHLMVHEDELDEGATCE